MIFAGPMNTSTPANTPSPLLLRKPLEEIYAQEKMTNQKPSTTLLKLGGLSLATPMINSWVSWAEDVAWNT